MNDRAWLGLSIRSRAISSGDALNRTRAALRRRDAVGRYEKRPGGDGIARRPIIFAQLALGPLPEPVPIGIDDEGISIRDAGPEWTAERAAEESVQVGMEDPARREPVVGCNDDQPPPVWLPRSFQLGRPRKAAQVGNGDLVNGLSIRLPAFHVRCGHEPENVVAPERSEEHTSELQSQ